MSNIKRIICAAMAALTLSSCSMSDIGIPGMQTPPDTASSYSGEADTVTAALTTEAVTTEYVEPVREAYTVTQKTFRNVVADDITFYDTGNNCNFSVIEQNGKYGIIDFSCNFLQPISFISMEYHESEPGSDEYFIGLYGDNYDNYYRVNADGSLTESYPMGWGYIGGVDLYWYNGAPIMFEMIEGTTLYTYSDYLENVYQEARYVPLREISDYVKVYDEWGYTETKVEYVSEKYAFLDFETGELITDFVYDAYSGNGFAGEITAAKRNGGWGYINTNGEEVTDFVYDALHDDEWYCEVCPVLNGYTVVYKDGKYGIIDLEGETVIEPVYDAITDVNRYDEIWVKTGGTWDVWQITKN